MRTQWLAIVLTVGVLVACGGESAPDDAAAEPVEPAAAVEPEPEYTMDQVGRIGRQVETEDPSAAPVDASEAPKPTDDSVLESMDSEAQNSLEARDIES